MEKMAVSLGLVVLMMCSGCASIVSKSQYPVYMKSDPTGAKVTVKNELGTQVHKCTTPSTVTLSAKSGFFSSANYSFEFEKEGYYPGVSSLSGQMDSWYIGNILFGGLIGFLLVDPATGAMWRLDDTVYGNLSPDPTDRTPMAALPTSYDQHSKPELDRMQVTTPPAKTEVTRVPDKTKHGRIETTTPTAETALSIDFSPTRPSQLGRVHTRLDLAEVFCSPGFGQPVLTQVSSSTDLWVAGERLLA